jgi:pyruvate dehydrogenase E2 component (dihydrolipoamide acetyltransferase)
VELLTMTRLETITIPDIGDFKDVPVIEILVKPGDVIAVDDTLIVLESDKATLDVPAAQAGRVKEITVGAGDRVSRGSAFLVLEVAEAGALPASATPATEAPAVQPLVASPLRTVPEPTSAPAAPGPGSMPHASPWIRRFARELGVDLAQVPGTGPKTRVTREDVQTFIQARLAGGAAPLPAEGGLGLLPWPQIDFAKFGPIERTPLSKIRRISGANLARNATIIPHVTNFDEADITALEEFRVTLNAENAKTGPRLTLLPFIIKAAVAALKAFPAFNASLDGDDLILKRYYHIGFAADTPDGLVVPVIKNADSKGIDAIALEAVRLAGEAREGKLKLGDMQGATFTVSSLGGVGGTNFTPIINAPEVAILGMTRAQIKPVWDGAAFQPRLIQPVSLSWDHRVVDGVAAARFLVMLCRMLADFRRISL